MNGALRKIPETIEEAVINMCGGALSMFVLSGPTLERAAVVAPSCSDLRPR